MSVAPPPPPPPPVAVTDVLPVTLWKVAETVADPAATAVTTPAVLTVTFVVSELLQLAVLVTTVEVPSL